MKTRMLAIFLVAICSAPAFGDSNGTLGQILNSQTEALTGTFDHGAGIGNADNSTANVNFSQAWTPNAVRITGDATGILDFNGLYYLTEANINITPALSGATNLNAGLLNSFTPGPFAYDNDVDVALAGPGAGQGTWTFEFWDSFEDGPGADTISENVVIEFLERTPDQDEDGLFSLGTIGAPDTASSVGEFLLEDLVDQYSFTLLEDTTIDLGTDADPLGLSGSTVDTELGIFDSSGIMIAYDDDGGPGLYSLIDDFFLTAGDYTAVVAGFGSNMAAGEVGTLNLADVTGGGVTGDYAINLTSIPEPSAGLALVVLGLAAYRRRRG